MNIGLLGFEFESENKGCEALSYSFLSIIPQIFGEIPEIYYFSNYGVGLINQIFPNYIIHHIPLKIKDLTFCMIKAMGKCDIIFDITMGDSFSDIYSKEICLSNMRFKWIAELLSSKYILLPQTYGPFNDITVKKKARNILVKADKIYCRDETSQIYIKEMFNVYDSIFTTDLAFFLSYDKNRFSFSSRNKLGLNISGLLWKGGFTGDNQFRLTVDYKSFISTLIKKILSDTNYEIHLIPHVINLSNDAHDDDYKVCKEIHNLFPETMLSPIFDTPIDAKSYIANMDIFVGSRMHSTIAAFSSGIATIPVSYSRKFEGLFNGLGYNYSVNCREIDTDEAINCVMKLIYEKEKLHNAVLSSCAIIKNRCDKLLDELKLDCSKE